VIGLILGGVLTEWLSWRSCLYVNLVFAIPAAIGVLAWVRGTTATRRPRIDLAGALIGSGALFCLVYGLSSAQRDGWGNTLTVSLLVAAAVLIAVFVAVEARVAEPLLPLRIVADRNRGASLLTIAVGSCSFFAAYLFLTYFFQINLGYSPLRTGVSFLPMIAGLMVAVGASNLLLLPRLGPRPLVPAGMLIAAGAMWWLSHLSVDSTYAADVLGPMFVLGLGLGASLAPSITTATAGVAAADAGVGSAMVNTSQQIGGAVGAAALSAVFTNAVADYLTTHHPDTPRAAAAVQAAAAIHGYAAAFTVSAFIFLAGAVVLPLLLRSGRIAPTESIPVVV
jgi:predicted MFS family arabinose efflux permease